MSKFYSENSKKWCSWLMAVIFAVSTSFQFNDSDWYFWIPLYATACLVNLGSAIGEDLRIRNWARFGLWIGVLLFLKVSFMDGVADFWTMEMRERVVRERFGSGLVIVSMFLQLQSCSSHPNRLHFVAKHGLPILVGVSLALCFVFFVFQHSEMRY